MVRIITAIINFSILDCWSGKRHHQAAQLPADPKMYSNKKKEERGLSVPVLNGYF